MLGRTGPGQAGQEASRAGWCCGAVAGLKVVLAGFALTNLGLIAVGGVGFTLGLLDYWDRDDFTVVVVGSRYKQIIYSKRQKIRNNLFLTLISKLQCVDVLGHSVHHHGPARPPRHLPVQADPSPTLDILVTIILLR